MGVPERLAAMCGFRTVGPTRRPPSPAALRLRPGAPILVPLALLAVPHAALPAQQLVSDEPCANCRLQLDTLLTVAGADHPAFVSHPGVTGVSDSRGHRYFVFAPSTAEIKVFDRTGRFVHTIGRRGEGPGEFESARHVLVGPEDSLFVFDQRLARMTVFDPSWELARTAPFLAADVLAVDFLGNDRLAVAALAFNEDLIGLPLHIVSRSSGVILQSVGNPGGVFRPDMGNALRRRVAADPAGGFWASHFMQYVLERYDDQGRRQTQLVRMSDWFPARMHGVWPISPEIPPNPTVRNIHVDSQRRLWVNIAVPQPDFADAFVPDYEVGVEAGYSSSLLYGSRIEVIDLDSAKLLVSYYTDDFLALLPDNSISRYREEDDGTPVVTIEQPTIIAPGN